MEISYTVYFRRCSLTLPAVRRHTAFLPRVPDKPGKPLAPVAPATLPGPPTPGGPGGPGGPRGPVGPVRPGTPVAPAVPAGPGRPSVPGGRQAKRWESFSYTRRWTEIHPSIHLINRKHYYG